LTITAACTGCVVNAHSVEIHLPLGAEAPTDTLSRAEWRLLVVVACERTRGPTLPPFLPSAASPRTLLHRYALFFVFHRSLGAKAARETDCSTQRDFVIVVAGLGTRGTTFLVLVSIRTALWIGRAFVSGDAGFFMFNCSVGTETARLTD
jgi:hypothetical protein